jgi:hypothetical protein
MKRNYENKHVDLSMPGYIKYTLNKYQHPMPKRPQYAPHNWTVPAYDQRIQYDALTDASPPATSQEITCAQAIVDMLLYNARIVDRTLLVTLSTLASQLSVDIPPQLSARPGTIRPKLPAKTHLQSLPVALRTHAHCMRPHHWKQ